MYVRMIWGRLKRGAWGEYVSYYNDAADRITKDLQGFKGRQLLRSTENPDEGMSITVWDNLDALREYDRSQPQDRGFQVCGPSPYRGVLGQDLRDRIIHPLTSAPSPPQVAGELVEPPATSRTSPTTWMSWAE